MTIALDLPERFAGYLYAYPHKTAYRPFAPALDLGAIWRDEPPGPRFLYAHVPFCEMRCGFCNLFTQSRPPSEVVDPWLAALGRQAAVTADATGAAGSIARLAIGGGTPTILHPAQIEQLFDTLACTFSFDPARTATSVEVSPHTATAERLAVLADRGVHRISIGVESFAAADLRSLGRPQRAPEVTAALEAIRRAAFPVLNIDLIYGAAGQSRSSWRRSVRATLEWEPEELYLYPLYRRPLTGLARRPEPVDDDRDAHYELALAELDDAGYQQVSMRRFRRTTSDTVDDDGYDCQDDGMIGLGCGARSYTRSVHYSHDYAVSRSAVAGIIQDYVALTDAEHGSVRHGFVLDEDEQRRRYVIKSVLHRPGLDRAAYVDRFGADAVTDLPVLAALEADGYLSIDAARIIPTATGLAWSDAVGSVLVSSHVRRAMQEAEVA